MHNVMHRVIEIRTKWIVEKNETPTVIGISLSDEAELAMLPASEIDATQASELLIHGPRVAFRELFGMKVQWGLAETKILG